MKTVSFHPIFKRASFLLLLFFLASHTLSSQNLLSFLESCKECKGQVKAINTRQKTDVRNNQGSVIIKREEFDENGKIQKEEIKIDGFISKTIFYYYKDSLLIYELHKEPRKKDYFLVYQYYQKKIPKKIIKVKTDHTIIDYAELEYTKDLKPAVLTFFSVVGDLLEKRSVEYLGNNHVVIRYFYPKIKDPYFQKYELFCKYNTPDKLKKNDFRDVVTRPINLERADNMLTVVKAVKTQTREQIHIDELSYDEYGNWVSKKTFELKKNKSKRRLVEEITREIEYY